MSIDNELIQRAILMLRIAGTHCQQLGSQDTSFYDGVDCDGSCIENDCHATAGELERMSSQAAKASEQPVECKEAFEAWWMKREENPSSKPIAWGA